MGKRVKRRPAARAVERVARRKIFGYVIASIRVVPPSASTRVITNSGGRGRDSRHWVIARTSCAAENPLPMISVSTSIKEPISSGSALSARASRPSERAPGSSDSQRYNDSPSVAASHVSRS